MKVNRLLSIAFFLVVLPAFCFAQAPYILSIEGIGSDGPDMIDNHVVKTDDGGFIIKLSSFPFSAGNIPNCHNGDPGYQRLFRKYNADGNIIEWDRCYPPGYDITDTTILYLFPADNGNFYTIRSYGVVGEWKRFCLNLENSNQNTIWTGPGYGNAQNLYLSTVCRASDGGFFLAFSSDFAGGDVPSHYGSNTFSDIWIIKLDEQGNHVWDKVIGGSYRDIANKILPTSDGGCFIAGFSASNDFDGLGNHGNTDAYVVKLAGDGNKIWHKAIGGPGYDMASDIVLTEDYELYIAGTAGENGNDVHNHHGGDDMYLVKMDTAGNILMDNCYGGQFDEEAFSIAISPDNSIWLTGESHKKGGQVDTSYGSGTSSTNDCWTVKVDNAGNFVCAKVLGAIGHDEGVLIYPLSNGGVIIGGKYSAAAASGSEFLTSLFGSSDVFLVRFAPWTTSVSQNTFEEEVWEIYPNPATNELHIKCEQAIFSFVSIMDGLGREVVRETLAGKETVIDIKDLPPAFYFIRLEGENGRETSRLVKY